jgi:uncharacterized membrane protein YkvA (DUF1232 family)
MSSPAEPASSPGWYQQFKNAVKKMKREVLAVYYAVQDPQVGLLPRTVAAIALAYALSPLDLIPDFIPILGLVDDLLILPALLFLAVYLIPAHVMDHARERAANEPLRLANNWIAAVLFLLIWNVTFGWIAWILIEKFGSRDVREVQWYIIGGVVGLATVGEVLWAVLQIRSERRKKATAISVEEPLLQGTAVEEP